MKKFIIAVSALLLTLTSIANESPRWLRQNAISPDGKTVAFVYQGDIFIVPSTGGEAVQLTTNPAHDTEPRWSPDGKYVIFASYREGQKDLWAVSIEGGSPARLTDYGGAQTPYAVSKDGKIIFSAYYQESATTSAFPGQASLYSLDFAEALAAQKDKLPVPARIAAVRAGTADVGPDGTKTSVHRKTLIASTTLPQPHAISGCSKTGITPSLPILSERTATLCSLRTESIIIT